MKLILSYGCGKDQFEIHSHAGIFFLKHNGTKIAKGDNEKTLKAYIDGFNSGKSNGIQETKGRFETGELVIHNNSTWLSRKLKEKKN